MQNAEVALLFEQFADVLEIQGENPFKIRAYRNAARTIENLSESLADVIEDPQRDLEDLPGIGKEIAAKIQVILDTGKLPQLEEARTKVPPGVVEMLGIPGLGPKKVAALFSDLQITSLAELKAAAEQGKIAELKGFGKKTQQTILENIESVTEAQKRFYLADAKEVAEIILEDLLSVKGVKQGSIAGSCRRRRETVGDLDVLITAKDSEPVMDQLARHELVEKVLARGETKQRVRLTAGIELDLRVVPEESYGAAMQYFTGSKEHSVVLRRMAQERGWKLNEYGLYEGNQLVAGKSEEELYQAFGLDWIPPELRENRGEFEAAESHKLPRLLEVDDMKGDLHMHTTASDGRNSILDMAEAAKARGLQYIAITDHSKRVSMANGLDEHRLREHWKAIEEAQKQIEGITILKGVECDILEDATMDLPDDVLAEADWVIAVLHYGLTQPKEQIMKRLMAAIHCPHVCMIGHPTGRMLLKRRGAEIDFDDLFKAAADHGVLMEINAHPKRLDLDDVHAAAAKKHGIPIVINTDAHSTSGLELMQYGVFQARRAGLEKQDVANTRTLSEFRKLLRKQ